MRCVAPGLWLPQRECVAGGGVARRRGLSSSDLLPEALDLFGDKVEAKRLAGRCGVPVIEGTSGPTTLDQARAFSLRSALGERR